jgi:hypothetical protein
MRGVIVVDCGADACVVRFMVSVACVGDGIYMVSALKVWFMLLTGAHQSISKV